MENLLNNDGDNFSGAEVALEFAQDTACVGSSNTATDLPGVHNSNSGNKNAIVWVVAFLFKKGIFIIKLELKR